MDDSLSIFDRGFLDTPYVRRRELLPLALKIYIWIGMVISGLILINTSFQVFNYQKLTSTVTDPAMIILPLVMSVLGSLILFLMTFLLWMEVKWAVKFNIVIGITWFCIVVLMLAMLPNMGMFYLILPFLLIQIPYFVLVFLLRKKWTRFYSLTGKELKELIEKNQPYRHE